MNTKLIYQHMQPLIGYVIDLRLNAFMKGEDQ